ncbi:MAG: Unknown protein [uncultured Sulfurovum sp.]|uniref:Caspase family p20 domain-containing protein n=1 Tax=uncultured Sulfurovum sp. TaxID=269237 RepID=A0A6S6U1V6_9BACT|nr:MAG: Unknown protein [uncultured Sulfurovum sp.]
MRLILILLLTINLLQAQKLALVIGNSNYQQGFLPNPTKDADLIAQNLRSVGFSVTLRKNLKTAYDMEEVINTFAKTLSSDDIAVVYYAGHGVQCNGKNYLMPTKANVAKGGQLKSKAVDLDFLTGGVSDIKLAIVMLDACRNNTFPSCGRTRSRGLVQPNVESNGGMIISFATASNEIALDGNGNHSPYALALTKFMNQSMPVETYFRKVGGEVFRSSEQRPMLKNSFYGSFSFAKKPQVGSVHRPIVEAEKVDISTSKWITPKDSVCKANGGEIDKHGACKANWNNAKKICSASGGQLPSRDDLKQVVVDCGGIVNSDWLGKDAEKNKKNSSYQSCYKEKGFSSFNWTREEKDSSYAWIVGFVDGGDGWRYKTDNGYALCVR